MTWPFHLRRPQRLFSTVVAVIAAVSAPTFAAAQTNAKPAKPDDREEETRISSEQMTGRPDRELVLERDVEITRGDTTVNSDHAIYRAVEDEVELTGNIRMKRFGDRFTGDKLRLKMDTGVGYVTNSTFYMQESNGQGTAERIDFESEDRAVVTEGTFSTCEGPDPDWYIKSSTLKLDTGREVGNAEAPIVYFKGVPILGALSMSFPLSGARKSGFLAPTQGTTSTGGLEVSVPYYFNIAPNRDLTLTPRYIARRGMMLGADARYMDSTYAGETKAEFLPNDDQTKTNRWSIASVHTQKFSPETTFNWNINSASDNNYPSDFSRNLSISTQRLLLRDINLSYASTFWTATARASNYQVLQDPASPITRPYDRLPQLSLVAARQDVNGFDWTANLEATRFWHPDLVRGERYVVNPSLSYPIVRPSYFVTPKISLNAATYSVQDPLTNVNSKYNRALPTFSLDSGLVFERETTLFGTAATQTLEPRLFYVNTPYRDQSQFPLFDTATADLSFAQIFSENRFIGNDRISDANQLTAAMVSRYIEESGTERLRVALAQRFYFSDQRVTLGTPLVQNKSDLLASGVFQLSKALRTEGNVQYSSSQKTVSRGNAGVSWRPEPKKVLNLTYRVDVPNALRQVDISGQWPIADRWYGVGRLNYSLKNDYANRPGYTALAVPPARGLSEGLLGLEYKADCWIFRVVAQRIPTATGKSTSTLFFQLELSGLTRLGSDPLEALRTSIPGYQVLGRPSNSSNY
ncbi:LPS-assembly protein LptD precursor [compost metagenome]